MNEVNINLGDIIKKARMRKGLSQKDLARILNVNPSRVCRWESNKRTPETYNLLRLINILDISGDLFSSLTPPLDSNDGDISPFILKKLEELTQEVRSLKEQLQLQNSSTSH